MSPTRHRRRLAATLLAALLAALLSWGYSAATRFGRGVPPAGTLEVVAGLHIAPDRELLRRNGLLDVGIQVVVDRDGTIYALYPETVIARHVIALNHVAIGIENAGDGDLPARWLPGRRHGAGSDVG